MSRPRPSPGPPPTPPPPGWGRFTIKQLMILVAATGVLSFLAAPTARTHGWGVAAALVGTYLLAMYVAVRAFGNMG